MEIYVLFPRILKFLSEFLQKLSEMRIHLEEENAFFNTLLYSTVYSLLFARWRYMNVTYLRPGCFDLPERAVGKP